MLGDEIVLLNLPKKQLFIGKYFLDYVAANTPASLFAGEFTRVVTAHFFIRLASHGTSDC